ncbi:MAG: restriction endonuclease [Acidobacteriaceae bacterium]|jgi:restriction endonuclease Mrr|nr:restriction endonuclease [Acidobacteriaceae bacterium]
MRRQPVDGTVAAEVVKDRAVEWKDDLISVTQGLTAEGFERRCHRILRESGFLKVEVTGRSGNGGIDGVGVRRVARLSFQVCVQCKKWKRKMRAKDIRDFRGAMVGLTGKGCSCPPASPSPHGESARDFVNRRMHELCPVRPEVGHPRRAVNQFLVWAWRRRETTSGKRRRGAPPAPPPPCQL